MRGDPDWSQSRVVFVAPSFTENQILATNFKDVAIELWEVKKYDNNLVSFNQIKKTSKESIKQIANVGGEIEEVTKEIVVYNEEDHLAKGSPAIQELYRKIRDRILEYTDLELSPVKQYIGFKLGRRVVTDMEIQRKQLRMRINLKKGMLEDPKGLFRDVSNIGTFGVGDYEAALTTDDEIDYLMSLVKQSYSFHKKN